MDGTNPLVIIEKDLGWPNAIAVAYDTQELFILAEDGISWSSVRTCLLSFLVNTVMRSPLSCRLRGRLVPGAAACKVLDEVSVLFTWEPGTALLSSLQSSQPGGPT